MRNDVELRLSGGFPMTRRITFAALLGVLMVSSGVVTAQELLTNGGLELVFPDMGGRDSAPPGWALVEGPMVPERPGPYPGDYSENLSVDAADYTVWRDRLGATFTLPNESPI